MISTQHCYHRYLILLVCASLIWSFIAYLSVQPLWLHVESDHTIWPPDAWPTDWHAIEPDDANIVWFVQVSDVHISRYKDADRATDLRQLCRYISSAINPVAMVITGDLTDAKTENHVGSRQIDSEWNVYKQLVQECETVASGRWRYIDIRGNHDMFDVSSPNEDRYHKIRGHAKAFANGSDDLSTVQTDILSYPYDSRRQLAFVGIDMTSWPGLKRPLNFFGRLTDARHGQVRQTVDAVSTARSNLVENITTSAIFYGHYPTSVVKVARPHSSLAAILAPSALPGHDVAYISGHLHKLLGIADKLYARHPRSDLLELELADWKDNRFFRIAAFDQGRLAFNDFKFGRHDIDCQVVVTHPQPVSAMRPARTSSDRRYVNQIRMLVFSVPRPGESADSPRSIRSVSATIVGEDYNITVPMAQSTVSAHLFTSNAGNSDLLSRLLQSADTALQVRQLIVSVTMSNGRSHVHMHTFAMAVDSRQPLMVDTSTNWLSADQILLNHWSDGLEYMFTVGSAVFMLYIISSVVIQVYCLNSRRHRRSRYVKSQLEYNVNHDNSPLTTVVSALHALTIVGTHLPVSATLVAMTAYQVVGPWMVAEIFSDQLGIVFVHGIWSFKTYKTANLSTEAGMGSHWLDPDVTYLYGVLSLIFIYFPLLAIFTVKLNHKDRSVLAVRHTPMQRMRKIFGHMPFILTSVAFSVANIYDFYHAYGALTLISPITVGRLAVVLAVYKEVC